MIVWRFLKIVFILLVPVVLWILPVDYFDKGASVSLFAVLGIEDYVYSTGMTRGVMHLMHFDFQVAMDYNKLSLVVLPLLIVLWLKFLLKEFGVVVLKWF